jgi:Repeat of unknown function (DUF5907)
MAIPPAYPPYQQPLLDPRTGRVSKPWHLFFLSLSGGATDGGEITDGSITLDKLQPIPSPRLLGRGSSGNGPVEILSLGTGLAMTGTILSVTAAGPNGIDQLGYWTPITNGDPLSPEILFDAEGDCVVGFVPTP